MRRSTLAATLGTAAILGALVSTPAVAAPTATDGRISLTELNNATLQIPAWPSGDEGSCAHGAVKFTKGAHDAIRLHGQPVYSDVDHDGVQETAILVGCHPQWSDYQVLAFERNAAGKIVSRGQVLRSGPPGRPGKDIMQIWQIAGAPNGDIRADVGEYRPCCMAASDSSQHQWRTYGLRDKAWKQTGGPTVFGQNPHVTDLVVTGQQVVMKQDSKKIWRGILTVTVRNAGPTMVKYTGIDIVAGSPHGTTGWEHCGSKPNGEPDLTTTCTYGGIAPGRSMTLRYGLYSVKAPTPTIRVDVTSLNANRQGYPDSNYRNNAITIAVKH